jgi:hypothetical protein
MAPIRAVLLACLLAAAAAPARASFDSISFAGCVARRGAPTATGACPAGDEGGAARGRAAPRRALAAAPAVLTAAPEPGSDPSSPAGAYYSVSWSGVAGALRGDRVAALYTASGVAADGKLKQHPRAYFFVLDAAAATYASGSGSARRAARRAAAQTHAAADAAARGAQLRGRGRAAKRRGARTSRIRRHPPPSLHPGSGCPSCAKE